MFNPDVIPGTRKITSGLLLLLVIIVHLFSAMHWMTMRCSGRRFPSQHPGVLLLSISRMDIQANTLLLAAAKRGVALHHGAGKITNKQKRLCLRWPPQETGAHMERIPRMKQRGLCVLSTIKAAPCSTDCTETCYCTP